MHLRTTNLIQRLNYECKRRTKPMVIVRNSGRLVLALDLDGFTVGDGACLISDEWLIRVSAALAIRDARRSQ